MWWTYVPATAGSRCKLRRSPVTSPPSISMGSSLKPRASGSPSMGNRTAPLLKAMPTTSRRWWIARWTSWFLANASKGVPDKPRLAAAVASVLKPGGLFVIVNWHARPREETTVLGEPRGPETALRIGPEVVKAALQQTAFKPVRTVDVPPYHYASIFTANSN